MGRIKTGLVKRLTKEIMRAHADQFTSDFQANKDVLKRISNMPSKKIRNIVAGYTTRLKRVQKSD